MKLGQQRRISCSPEREAHLAGTALNHHCCLLLWGGHEHPALWPQTERSGPTHTSGFLKARGSRRQRMF